MQLRNPDPEFKKSVLFGLVGSWVAVALSFELEVLESFLVRLFLTVFSVVCLLTAFYFARKSQAIPI